MDTHTLLWWWTNDAKLSKKARALIVDEGNTIFVSAASAWEIATKHRLGKLGLAFNPMQQYSELIEADGFEHLAVTHQHSLLAGGFDGAHRDPFDRILAAQSKVDNLPLISMDKSFLAFAIKPIW